MQNIKAECMHFVLKGQSIYSQAFQRLETRTPKDFPHPGGAVRMEGVELWFGGIDGGKQDRPFRTGIFFVIQSTQALKCLAVNGRSLQDQKKNKNNFEGKNPQMYIISFFSE
jgi:hypothetical protein